MLPQSIDGQAGYLSSLPVVEPSLRGFVQRLKRLINGWRDDVYSSFRRAVESKRHVTDKIEVCK